jgi:nucleotide-binding universal stress UspA family protein
MKSILVPVGPGDEGRAALHLAAATVKRSGGLVEGVPLRMPVIPSLDWGMIGTVTVEEPGIPPEQLMDEARSLFSQVMNEHGIGIADGAIDPDAGGAMAIWNGSALIGNDLIGQYGRAFDLTCVSQPVARGSSIATLEAALFDSGGPILIAPQGGATSFGKCVVIAWNGSDETARTIAFAEPILMTAERVVILADREGPRARPPGELIHRRLRLEGIPSELRLFPEGDVLSGETILAAAAEEGCDLLVKGAYTQSRIRQIIFGGATKHVLAHARMPVFMAH